MADQSFVITGGAGGIGSALARRLAARGDRVVLFGRRPEPLMALAEELGGDSVALAVPGDARIPADLDRAVQAAIEAFGHFDGLAHCIGSIRLKSLHMTTPEEFAETIAINLTTAFLASRGRARGSS